MNSILVTAKINPDLDGCACVLAYADFLIQNGKNAEGVIFGCPQSEVSYFSDRHGIMIPTCSEETTGEWTHCVLVDGSSMMGMPKAVIPEHVIEIIDHRAGSEPKKEFPNAKIQNELVGAAATLVTERFMNAGRVPSREHALLLYGAIHHNSLNFLSTNTHQRDHDAVEFFEKLYGFDRRIIEEMFRYATDSIIKDPYTAIEDDGKEFGKGYTIGAYQLIVWGDEILQKKRELEEAVKRISAENGEQWAVLNIIDVAQSVGFLYCTHADQYTIVEQALAVVVNKGWTSLKPALLRKQIMPLISKIANEHE